MNNLLFNFTNNKKLLISIIILVNNPEILKLQLKKLSSYNNIEIILTLKNNEILETINNFNFKYTIGNTFNHGFKKSSGDILLFLYDNIIIDEDIITYIYSNFIYNQSYIYKINNTEIFLISRNYFKLLNKFNDEYNYRFTFDYQDFLLKIKHCNNLQKIYIDNNFTIIPKKNKYKNIINYNEDNVKKLAIKELYLMNTSLINYYKNNLRNKIIYFIIDKTFNKSKLFQLKDNIKENNYYVIFIVDKENKYLRNIKYLKNISVILINLFDNFEENIIKWFGGYIFKFNDDYEYRYLFFNITNTDKKYNFYMKNIEKYKNVLIQNNNIETKNVKLKTINSFNSSNIIDYLVINKNNIFILDDLTISILIQSYKNYQDIIDNFVSNNKYYILINEYFMNEKLIITGCGIENYEFTKLLFTNSLKTVLLNTRNIRYLLDNNINNYEYFPAYGYSLINNIKPIENNDKEIDVLWYGNIGNTSFSSYRRKIIKMLDFHCKKNNIHFKQYDNLYDEKDIILSKTKIVIHIPQKKDYHILSWAKIVELMAKKVFFIIEENEEIFIKNLENIICISKRNNFNELLNKIIYYLQNEDKRNEYIENSFYFIKNNYNMDDYINYSF